MDVLSAIKNRRSIRKYQPRPIEKEKLEKVLEAARLAPSAMNTQPWRFIVVQDENLKEEIKAAAGGREFFTEAPVILVACGLDTSIMTCGHRMDSVNLSIAMSFVVLEAYEQGLGTCWIGSHNESKIKKILQIPEEYSVVTITPLGYPAEDPAPKPRKTLEEVISYNKFE